LFDNWSIVLMSAYTKLLLGANSVWLAHYDRPAVSNLRYVRNIKAAYAKSIGLFMKCHKMPSIILQRSTWVFFFLFRGTENKVGNHWDRLFYQISQIGWDKQRNIIHSVPRIGAFVSTNARLGTRATILVHAQRPVFTSAQA
jgi:hypothetical protein